VIGTLSSVDDNQYCSQEAVGCGDREWQERHLVRTRLPQTILEYGDHIFDVNLPCMDLSDNTCIETGFRNTCMINTAQDVDRLEQGIDVSCHVKRLHLRARVRVGATTHVENMYKKLISVIDAR